MGPCLIATVQMYRRLQLQFTAQNNTGVEFRDLAVDYDKTL